MTNGMKYAERGKQVEKWQQIGQETLRAVVNNSRKEVLDEIKMKYGELGSDNERTAVNNILFKELANAKTEDQLKAALVRLGMPPNYINAFMQAVKYNFSSIEEFASIFKRVPEGTKTVAELINRFRTVSTQVEQYIWNNSEVTVTQQIKPLMVDKGNEPLANFFVRKHYGMTREELSLNFGIKGADELEIVTKFINQTLGDKKFISERQRFLTDYKDYSGNELLQKMDLLGQRAFLMETLPILYKRAGSTAEVGKFIKDETGLGLLRTVGIIESPAHHFSLFSQNVYVLDEIKGKDGKTVRAVMTEQKGAIPFALEKTDYTLEQLRTTILPYISMRIANVYKISGPARERAAFYTTSIDVAYAFIEAQKMILKGFIENFLQNPSAFSAFADKVPELKETGLKSISREMADAMIRRIDDLSITPQDIKTVFDFGIFALIEGNANDKVKDTIMRLRWVFTPGSLQMIPDRYWTKSVLITPSADAFRQALERRPIPFSIYLPTILSTASIYGDAYYSRETANGKTTSKSETGKVIYTMWGASGGKITSTLDMGEPQNFSVVADDLTTSNNWKIASGIVKIEEGGPLKAGLENYFKKSGSKEEEYLYTFFERTLEDKYIAKGYYRDGKGTWYRLTFEDTRENLMRAFGVYYSADHEARMLFDNNEVGAFIVGLKLGKNTGAAILQGRDNATLAKTYGGIITQDNTGAMMGGERAVSFMKVYSNAEAENVKKNYQIAVGQVGKKTGAFWTAMASPKTEEYGIHLAWRKKETEVNLGILQYWADLDAAAQSNAAYFAFRQGANWCALSHIKEIDRSGATSRAQDSFVGVVEYKTKKGQEVRLQGSVHDSKTSGEQAVDSLNSQIKSDLETIRDAHEKLKTATRAEDVAAALADIRSARDDLEKQRKTLNAVSMLLGKEYMGTFKVKVKDKNGVIGYEAVGGKDGMMLNHFAVDYVGSTGRQFIVSTGNARGVGGKTIFKIGDAAVAMLTGGVIVQNEFGTKFLLYGGTATKPTRAKGTGGIIGGYTEKGGDLNKDIIGLEGVLFKWQDSTVLRGGEMKQTGWYAAIKGEKGSYIVEQMDETKFREYKARYGQTIMTVEKNYAAIESLEYGVTGAAGSIESGGGTTNYVKVGPFVQWAKKTSQRESMVEASIMHEWDRYRSESGTSHKGSLLLFGFRGSAIYGIWVPL